MSTKNNNKIICPFCGEEVDDTLTECPICGGKLLDEVLICPRCTEKLHENDSLCPLCGVRISKNPSKYSIEYGNLYIITDESFSYRLFNTISKLGYKGLCLSKVNPQKIEKKHSLTGAEIYWLTSTQEKEKAIDPQRLDFELMYTISEFIKNNKSSVIIIDGITLLISSNGVNKVLDFIKYISDLISTQESIVIIPVIDMASLDPKFLSQVKEYSEIIDYSEIQNEVAVNNEAGKLKIITKHHEDIKSSKKDNVKKSPAKEAPVSNPKSKVENQSNENENENVNVNHEVENKMDEENMPPPAGPMRIKLRDSETGAVLEMELDPENTIDEIIESSGSYWEKTTGVYVIRKGNRILRGGMKIGESDLRDGDVIELIPDPEGGLGWQNLYLL
ncbi:MAG: DUF835 domain-containing protein [Thermoplasmata archaeon]